MKIKVKIDPDELIYFMKPHQQDSNDEPSQPCGKVLVNIDQNLAQCVQDLSPDFFQNI